MRMVIVALGILIQTPCFAEDAQQVPVSELGRKFTLIGRLGLPLGTVATISGVIVDAEFKGEGDHVLSVQRIDKLASQERLRIEVSEYFNKWGREASEGHSLPGLVKGDTYELEGYETGGYDESAPIEAYRKADIILAKRSFGFRTWFVVYKGKKVDPSPITVNDFKEKTALFQGIAKSQDKHSLMAGDGWTVIVDSKAPWPKDIDGKNIETFGKYTPGADGKTFTLTDGTWRLIRLEDQVGRAVELRGEARSMNGVWWFHYRGTDLYVEDMEKLPGWRADNHWRPMVISGTLGRENLPRLDQIALKKDRDLKEYFIVRKASWKPLSALLNVERQ